MEDNLKQAAMNLFENVDIIVEALTPRKRVDIDELMIVYVDTMNGKLKHRTSYNMLDMWAYLREGSKPIGIIFFNWTSYEDMKVKEFPKLTIEEQQLLAHAFAEVQDEHMDDHAEEV